ncbi:hypothetical protein J2S54_007021 [Streptomyces sp. DSM 42143]|uniref:hypothetical protein n=1 Tax=Streptomyces TaxID=1883 RepID=UPI0025B26790|nr:MULTISPECIES: hypothetical protein [unclassified Streptomyces]MDN3249614.1 hypothetical protein [Streptomyces sp. ZSW22]MDQ0390116.1 hypothetical protein [Streptomyces sp. DSM 42143]
METESARTVPPAGADPVTRGLLVRLRASAACGEPSGKAGRQGPDRGTFLPELPDAQLLGVLSAYYRRPCRVEFSEPTGRAA